MLQKRCAKRRQTTGRHINSVSVLDAQVLQLSLAATARESFLQLELLHTFGVKSRF